MQWGDEITLVIGASEAAEELRRSLNRSGATHAGSFDIAYLSCLPGFTVMAAADEAELKHMVATAVAFDDGPISFRYPRGEGVGVELPERGSILPIGKGRITRQGTKVALLSFGSRHTDCMAAAEELEDYGLSTTVADARFAKPLDTELIEQLARHHELLVTIEEGSTGGFGAMVLHHLASAGVLDIGLKIRTMTMPDVYVDQMSPDRMIQTAGLDKFGIVQTVFGALGKVNAQPALA